VYFVWWKGQYNIKSSNAYTHKYQLVSTNINYSRQSKVLLHHDKLCPNPANSAGTTRSLTCEIGQNVKVEPLSTPRNTIWKQGIA